MKRYILIVLAVMMVSSLSAQYKVIVNSANPATTISKKDASDYFLKKSTKWPDGTKVTPVDQQSSSAVRESFSSDVLGKSVNAVKSYWQQFVFAGKGTPPTEKGSDQEVINYVKNNPGAIGYVSSGASISGVKEISVSN